MRHWTKALMLAAVLGLASWTASAQEASESPLMTNLAVEKVEIDEESEEEVLTPAPTASPGDLLQYTGRYTNVSDAPLNGLVVNGSIPVNTVFSEEGTSASVAAVFEVLVSGEDDWQSLPAFKTVTSEDGTETRVPAEPADFREIRWRLAGPLEPEETVVTVYRVHVAQ